MSFSEAVQHFSLLTVGDGLVAQIPALLISTATGIIVTRSVGESNLGQDLAKQIVSQPRALFLAGIVARRAGARARPAEAALLHHRRPHPRWSRRC